MKLSIMTKFITFFNDDRIYPLSMTEFITYLEGVKKCFFFISLWGTDFQMEFCILFTNIELTKKSNKHTL